MKRNRLRQRVAFKGGKRADIFSITVTGAAIKQQKILKHFSSAWEYWQQKLFSPRCDTQAELPAGSLGTADWCR